MHAEHSDCQYCGGDMFVAYDDADDGGEHVTFLEPCPVCVSDGVPELIEDGNDTTEVAVVTMQDLVRSSRATVEVQPLEMLPLLYACSVVS